MKKLRIKLMQVVILSLILVFALLNILIFVALKLYFAERADSVTRMISQHNGTIPEFKENSEVVQYENFMIKFDEESAFRTRYFIVYLNENNEKRNVDIEHIAAISETEAGKMADAAVAKGSSTGYIGKYRYRVGENADGRFVIFLECSENISIQKVVMILTVLISLIFIFLITILFAAFSKKVVKPFEENTERQKCFITNASHELKTPLAIISANMQVLELKNGKDEWSENIVDQTQHMSGMINDLLTLAKMEEMGDEFSAEPVNFSLVIEKETDQFLANLIQKNVRLSSNIASDIYINGNQEQIKRLISVLLENASKYVSEGGEVRLSLKRSGRTAYFEVYNTAVIDPETDYSRIFDRFYRPDSARNSMAGGQGIGLSIAQKIVLSHKGRIEVRPGKEGISFLVQLPCHGGRSRYKGAGIAVN